MVKALKYVVTKIFQGLPKRADYKIVETELPSLQNGEILVKAEWISVDPYLRYYHSSHQIPYDQFSYQVGIVQESKNPDYPVGTRVVAHKGWCNYYVTDTKITETNPTFYKLPDLKGLSPSLGLSAVGMPAATAYFGLLEICKSKAGETLVVTGAAGAVGSIVGQIAKIKGLKVIGFAGSDDKVQWLEQELGFDKAFNYKTVDVAAALKEAAPEGVNCYYDNVGGEISSIIMNQMTTYGRVALCGSISAYNDDPNKMTKATVVQPAIVFKELKVEGFLTRRWKDKWPVAFEDMVKWIHSGQVKPRESITEGFDQLYEAFVGMLKGENTGKAVVKV